MPPLEKEEEMVEQYDWIVYDPGEDDDGPQAWGFHTEADAWEYANALYPDDGNGLAVVVRLQAP